MITLTRRTPASFNSSTRAPADVITGDVEHVTVDRVANGYVVDFVDFHVWPVFNLADSCIVGGILAIVLFVADSLCQ